MFVFSQWEAVAGMTVQVSVVDIHLQKHLWVYCPGHARVKGNGQADGLAGKAAITNVCVSEDLRC